MIRLCNLENCQLPLKARSYCDRHYRKLLRYGDPLFTQKMRDGRTKNPLYSTYCGILARCDSASNPYYRNYGGRGIKVCERWRGIEGFTKFIEDMGERPLGTSIDRRDNDGNYEPSNCGWATRAEQMNNTRKNRFITMGGETKTLVQWINESGLKNSTVRMRINIYGWDIRRALETKVGG